MGFQEARNGEYVDKSGLIAVINNTLNTELRFSCVIRSRRFGKTMAAKMLCAYYDKSCESKQLFEDLEIAKEQSFEKHLNKYPVIYLDMTDFVTRFKGTDIVARMHERIMADIIDAYPETVTTDDDDLMDLLMRISNTYKQKFILIIDEWDAILREFGNYDMVKDGYVNFLRRMFKSVNAIGVFAGVYMTGILPIKKNKTQSALNNFKEYSMVTPGPLASYFGFTKKEVCMLSDKHGMSADELEKWYDGYQIGCEMSMFNPNSVMEAVRNEWCENYWSKTGAYDAISSYISMNYEGLKDAIIIMLAGGRCKVNPTGFKNDLAEVHNIDDVLTVLIHLGYLSYDRVNQMCFIPNKEVSEELTNAIQDTGWTNVLCALRQSERLLRATLEGDEAVVAQCIDAVHDENTSILSYNDENSLACVISLAYYYAKNDYVIHRELASGKGIADIVMIPRKNVNLPAIVVELKYNHDSEAAISQIKRKNYPAKLQQRGGDILLVGINYDKNTKQHECKIEKWNISHLQ